MLCAGHDDGAVTLIEIKKNLYEDIERLKEVLDENNFLHYIINLRIEAEDKYQKLVKHTSRL